MTRVPSVYRIVSAIVIVVTIATPMAFIELGAVPLMLTYPISGWTFIFGCVNFYSDTFHYRWPVYDPRFDLFLALAAIWISVAIFLAVLLLLRTRFRPATVVVLFTLILQVSAPILLLGGPPAVYVIPLPAPSVAALIGLLVLRQNLPSTI
ncbi:MAG: hypothetical protein ACFFER_15495 [Candidatus Thorarchaeota archaeon]